MNMLNVSSVTDRIYLISNNDTKTTLAATQLREI